MDREKIIKGFECCIKRNCKECPYKAQIKTETWQNNCNEEMTVDAHELLKMQYDAMKPIGLRKWHDGYVGDCPSCGRVVQFAQRYCHNCTRLLDWSEVLALPHEDDDEET